MKDLIKAPFRIAGALVGLALCLAVMAGLMLLIAAPFIWPENFQKLISWHGGETTQKIAEPVAYILFFGWLALMCFFAIKTRIERKNKLKGSPLERVVDTQGAKAPQA